MASDLSDLLDAKKCQFINAMCESGDIKEVKENAAMVSRINALKEAEEKFESIERNNEMIAKKNEFEERRLKIDEKKNDILEAEIKERKKDRFWNGFFKTLETAGKVIGIALGFKLGRDALKAEYIDKMIVPKDTKSMSNFLMKL